MGYLLFRGAELRADRWQWLVGLPGGKRILPLVLAVFVVKYAIQYTQAADPGMAQAPLFLEASLAAAAFTTGIFMARFCICLLKFRGAPDEALAVQPPAA